MEKQSYLSKSRYLLLFLFALIVGSGSAWADDPVTENFATNALPDGWSINNTISNSSYKAISLSSYAKKSGSYSLYANEGSATYTILNYVILPKVTGTISLFARAASNDTYGYLSVYRYSNGSLGTIVGSQKSKKSTSWGDDPWTFTLNENEQTQVAIVFGGLYVDEITVTYVPETNPRPKTLSFTSIATTTATGSWTAGSKDDSETGWDMEYKVASSDTWTEVHGIAKATTSYDFTSLAPNTSYDVRVRALYSAETSEWKTGSFKTLKVATVAEGFTDDFESDKGWSFVNSSVNKWYRGTGTNNGGSNALYISNDNGTSNAYTVSTTTVSYAMKYFSFTGGDYTFAYDWVCNGEGGYSIYDYLRVVLASDVELTADALYSGLSSTNLPSGWISLDGGALYGKTSWQNKSVNVPVPAGNYLVVLVWRNDNGTGNQPPAAIDNFSIEKQALSIPTGLAYSNLAATSVDLNWTANSAETEWQVKYGATGFDVATEGTAVVATTNPYTLSGLTPETAYDVYVRAKNGDNYSGWSTKVSFTTPEKYPKPSSLTSSDIAATTATISWTKNGTETAWEYSCTTNSAVPAEIGDYPTADATSKALTGLTENTTYYVYVRAKVGEEHSGWSAVHSFTTAQNPVDLTTGSFADDFETANNWVFVNGNLTNAWAIGPATNNGGTKAMYISKDGGTSNEYNKSSTTIVFAKKLFSLAQGKYEIAYDWKAYGESSSDFLRVAVIPASTTLTAGTTPSGLTSSALPSGWIAADGGSKLNLKSSWTRKEVEVEIPEAGNYLVVFTWVNDYSSGYYSPAAIDNFSIAFQACPKPTGVDKSNVKGTKATIAWDSADDTTWEVYISTESTKPADNQAATAAPTTNSYEFTGLTAETHYYAWVRAVKDAGKSDWVGVDFTTDVKYPAPTGLSANVAATSATLSWTAGDEETKWEVVCTTTSTTPAEEGDYDEATSTSHNVTGLTTNTTYYAWVRAKANDGHSAWSAVCNFTTAMETPFAQDFNVSSTPSGWTQYSGLMDDVITGTATLSSGSSWSFDNYNGIWTNKHARVNLYGTSLKNWLVTPNVELGSNHQIVFDLALTAYSGTKAAAGTTGTDDKFAVLISTDNGSSWTKLAQWDNAGGGVNRVLNDIATEGETVRLNLSAYDGQTAKFAFYAESTESNADNNLHLANVEIAEAANYSLAISGSDVSENTIVFGTVKNTTTTKKFTITNDGGEAFNGITVESSDAEVFTVSDTGFNLASGATKDITVTFVKAVDGDYTKKVTVSHTNLATPIELTVTATYVTPIPATIAISEGATAVGASVAFGIVGKARSKTFTVTNDGEATLSITKIESSNTTDFTVTPASLNVAGGETGEFIVNFLWDGDALNAEKTATITLTSNAATSPTTFTVTGTRDNLWIADFEGENPLNGWENTTNTTWTVNTKDSYENKTKMLLAPSGSTAGTIVTPCLRAKAGDILTWDAYFDWYNEAMTVEYSTDLSTWTKIYDAYRTDSEFGNVRNKYKKMSFTAPADDDYYLRFTSTYSNGIDNFEGFKLAPAKEHFAVIASINTPTGYQYKEYTASVTVTEKANKDDEVVTAELWINGSKVATESGVTLNAKADKVITLRFTPNVEMSGVEAYIKVYNENIDLTSATNTINIIAATVLDETVGTVASTGNQPSMVVKYTAKSGWNTICMPFALTDAILTQIFGEGYKIYDLKSYDTTEDILSFKTATSFTARKPYLVYVATAASHPEGVKLFNVNVTSTTASETESSPVTFQGTYAPIAAGDLTDWYGVTTGGEIRKASNTASLDGFRAYFTGVPASASARLSIYDEATGITTILGSNEVLKDNRVYNLNGQKIQNAKKGLYIVNGRKVVIK